MPRLRREWGGELPQAGPKPGHQDDSHRPATRAAALRPSRSCLNGAPRLVRLVWTDGPGTAGARAPLARPARAGLDHRPVRRPDGADSGTRSAWTPPP